jgi:hypothetical protein
MPNVVGDHGQSVVNGADRTDTYLRGQRPAAAGSSGMTEPEQCSDLDAAPHDRATPLPQPAHRVRLHGRTRPGHPRYARTSTSSCAFLRDYPRVGLLDLLGALDLLDGSFSAV